MQEAFARKYSRAYRGTRRGREYELAGGGQEKHLLTVEILCRICRVHTALPLGRKLIF